MIELVAPDGPAAKAGLRVNDIILKLGEVRGSHPLCLECATGVPPVEFPEQQAGRPLDTPEDLQRFPPRPASPRGRESMARG